jgi:Sulfotransferase family
LSQFSLRGGEIPGRRRVPGARRLDRMLRAIPHRWQKVDPNHRAAVPQPQEFGMVWKYLLRDGRSDPEEVRAAMTQLTDRLSGQRLLAKWGHFAQYLELLSAAFPEARFVHIVRDGRAVALSLRTKFEPKLGREKALGAAARHWVDVLGRAHSVDSQLLELRYEDFCEDVHSGLIAAMTHAGLNPALFPLDRCPRKLSSTNARWLEASSSHELSDVSDIQRAMLVRYGYLSNTERTGSVMYQQAGH